MTVTNVELRVTATGAVKELKRTDAEAKKLNATFEQTKRKTATATANIQRFGIAFRSVIAPVVALTGAVTFLNRSLGVFADRQADANLLASGLEKIGAQAGDLEKLQKIASDLGEQTLFNQEDFTQGFALLTSFRAIGQDSFERVSTAAADMAATTKQDVNSSLLQLAKALENPVQGMSALSRSGTTFTQVQKDIVKGLVESNKTLEAQSYILDLVEEQYKGNARAAAVGLAGAQDTLSEAVRDFNEVVGEISLGPAIAATNALTGLFQQATSELKEWNKAFDGLSRLLAPIAGGLDLVAQSFKNTTEIIKLGIPGLSATLQMYEKFIQLRSGLASMADVPGTSVDNRPEQGAALDPEAIARFRRQLELEDLFKRSNIPKTKLKSGRGKTPEERAADALKQQREQAAALLLSKKQEALLMGDITEEQRASLEHVIEKMNLRRQFPQLAEDELQVLRDQLDVNFGLSQADKDRIEQAKELKKAQDAEKKRIEDLNQKYQQIGDTISSGVVDALRGAVRGTKSLAEVATDMLNNIIDQMLQLAVNMALFGNATGTFSGGSGILGNIFGARANGGTVTGGRSYVVGERGPELFTPGRTGSIAPNDAFGGANIVVNVDASGSSVEGDAQQSKALGQALGAAVKAELIKQKMPGGLLA